MRAGDEPEKSTLFGGEFVADVHVFGQTVDIWVSPRTEEIDRRAAAGVGSCWGSG